MEFLPVLCAGLTWSCHGLRPKRATRAGLSSGGLRRCLMSS